MHRKQLDITGRNQDSHKLGLVYRVFRRVKETLPYLRHQWVPSHPERRGLTVWSPQQWRIYIADVYADPTQTPSNRRKRLCRTQAKVLLNSTFP